MILTQCPVCAAPLPDLTAKQCSRCKTRYCGPACQKKHWEEGGHANLCKKIKKGGGAEQYNANQKYTEAVSVAVVICAEDTKGQTCYICTQALHWKTKEGLVRGCSCRGTAGFAHVSCLAEQAKILVAEVEENNLDDKVLTERFNRWSICGLCEQGHHGVVACALGWACWKTYLGRPETDVSRRSAMSSLACSLSEANRLAEAVLVLEAELSVLRRIGASEDEILASQSNLANAYQDLGRFEQGSRMLRDVYSGRLKLNGKEHEKTLLAALNYAGSLLYLRRYDEAKTLVRDAMLVARRVLGESHEATLKMSGCYADALRRRGDPSAKLADLREAVRTLEDADRTARRVLGGAHPLTVNIERALQNARAAFAAREAAA